MIYHTSKKNKFMHYALRALLIIALAGSAYYLTIHFSAPTSEKIVTEPYNNYIIEDSSGAMTLHSLYGNFVITNEILKDIIKSPVMERLKQVKQYGVFCYAVKPDFYTRYDHSLGVLALLIKYNAPLKEQIAGLLHDASHTAFSHSGALVFNEHENTAKSAYQDDHHLEFLDTLGITPLLQKHGIALEEIDPKQPCFTALEQDVTSLSSICADRLEYTLHGGLRENLNTRDDITKIMDNLEYKDGIWFFTNPQIAKLFARISLQLKLNVWGSAENMVAERFLTKALKRAADLGIITKEEIHFSTDDALWIKLQQSIDTEIKDCLAKLADIHAAFVIDKNNYTLHLSNKFNSINPAIKTENEFKKLTDVDAEFKQEFDTMKELMSTGWHIRYVE